MKKYFTNKMMCGIIASSLTIPYVLPSTYAVTSYAEAVNGINIISQPQSVYGDIGDSVLFKVEATGVSGYQWQYNAGSSWANWSRATESSLEVEINSQKRKDYKFRCLLKGTDGTTKYTEVVEIKSKETPAGINIITQPQNVYGDIGDKVLFKVEATGVSGYQWQYNAGSSWANWSKATESSLEVEITSQKRKDYKFRCLLKGTDGTTKYTEVVEIKSKETPAGINIITQPQNVYGDIGDKVLFKVEATGVSGYQWQYNAGSSWANWSKATESSLEVEINSQKRKDYKFRCLLKGTDGTTKYTEVVEIKSKETPAGINIITQPQNVYGNIGDSVLFKVEATGVSGYQWQYNAGSSWANWSKATESSLEVEINSQKRKDYKFRCLLKGTDGTTKYTEVVEIQDKLTLISNPESVTITSDAEAVFTVQTTGTGSLTYVWESSTDGETWSACGENNSVLTIDGSTAVSGTQFRCTVSDEHGQSVTSETATLTIEPNDNYCGSDMTYTYKNGTLTISGTGYMEYDIWDNPVSPFIAIADKNNGVIDTVIVEDGVEGIGAYAFANIQVNNVILAESVRIIGKGAFNNTGYTTITVNYPALMFSNDSGLGAGDNIIGYDGSSAQDFANKYDLSFTPIEDDFEENNYNIYLNAGDGTSLNVSGKRLRYYSTDENVASVDSDGNITAVNEGSAMIFVYDVRGRSQTYTVHVDEEKLNLPLYQVLYPGESFTLDSGNVGFNTVQQKPDAFTHNGWNSFSSQWSATDEIMSYTDNGQSALTYVNAIVDVIEPKSGIEYSGSIEKDGADTGGVWYALKAGDVDVKVDLNISCGTEMTAHIYQEYTTGYFYNADTENSENSFIWSSGGYNINDSITVPAGKTYYLWVKPANEKGTGTYKLTANYTNHEYFTIDDNAEYTFVPSMAGEMTTLSFNVSEPANYLIETSGTKSYHYDVANNAEFEENEENGRTNMTTWLNSDFNYYLAHYPWLEEGSFNIRAWFDEETDENDYIKLHIHKVTASDEGVVINDYENPNVLSVNPDDFDRRTIEGEAGKKYYIYIESENIRPILCNQDWQDIGNWYQQDGYTIVEFTCEESQQYHFWLTPVSEEHRNENINVWVSAIVAEDVQLDAVYTDKATIQKYQEYKFTAPQDGEYNFASSKNPFITAESGDYVLDFYDADFNNIQNWTTDCYANNVHYMTAGETIYVRISPVNKNETTYYRFVVRNIEQPFNTEMLTDADNWKTVDMTAEDITEPAVFTVSDVTANSFTINVKELGAEDWYTQVFYDKLSLVEGNTYRLQFRVTSDNDSPLNVALQQCHVPYDIWGVSEASASDELYSFLIEPGTDGLVKLLFTNFQIGTYTISDISLMRVTDSNQKYSGTVTSDEPVWIPIEVDTDISENMFDVYEIVRNYGDVNIELYEENKETKWEHFYENGENHWRAYWNDPAKAYIKVSSNNGEQDYDISFIKFDRTMDYIADVPQTLNGEFQPYSVAWYQFTPSESGSYAFDFSSTSKFANIEFYINDTSNALGDKCGYWINSHSATLELVQGDIVWVKITDNQYDYGQNESVDYTVTVKKSVFNQKELTLDTPAEGHYEDEDNFDYFSFTAPEDGNYVFTSAQADNHDVWGYLYADEKMTEELAYDDNSAGSLQFKIDTFLTAGQTVYLKPIDYGQNESVDYTVIVEKAVFNQKELTCDTPTEGHFEDIGNLDYFSFTAPEDGTYIFTSAQAYNRDMYGYLYADEKMTEELTHDDNIAGLKQFKIETFLTAGQTVYLKPVSYESVNYTVTVRKVGFNQKELTLDTPAEGHYEGEDNFDYFSFTAPEDGAYSFTSAQADNHDMYGYLYADEKMTEELAHDDDSAGNSQFRIDKFLKAGQTVYLKPVDFGQNESVDYTVIVEKVVFNQKELTLDKPAEGHFEDVGNLDYFSFTAPEDGTYIFTSKQAYDCDIIGYLYNDAEMNEFIISEYDCAEFRPFGIEIFLTAGQTVYWKPVDYGQNENVDYTITVVKYKLSDDATKKELTLDTPAEGHFEDTSKFDYFSFTAPEDGTYIFTSAQADNYDMYGELYADAELTDLICSDFGSAGNMQFKIEAVLTAGQTVYLKPVDFGQNESVDYTVTVAKN